MTENIKKRNKKRNLLSSIILVIALGIFCYAGYNLWLIFSEYQKGTSEYKSLQEIATIQTQSSESQKEPSFVVDFDKLVEINSDVVAWIRFEEPKKISYPVVFGVDNSKYLTTTFEGKSNSSGTLFIDMQNQKSFSDKNTFIYGHNMKNGSMFGRLREYKSAEFCKEHPYFYIYTPDGKESTYQIFAVSIVKDVSESYTKYFANDTEFENYLAYTRKSSLYQTDVETDASSTIVSLSTCTNVSPDERLLVQGVKISEKVAGE